MSVCSNCKNQLSCGCQKRTASDNQIVCSSCLATYESKLQNPPTTTESNLDTWDKTRYKNLNK